MEFLWVLTALITVDGQTATQQFDAYIRPTECHQAINEMPVVAGVQYQCLGVREKWLNTYQPWPSQPSWMTPQQAERLRKKH